MTFKTKPEGKKAGQVASVSAGRCCYYTILKAKASMMAVKM